MCGRYSVAPKLKGKRKSNNESRAARLLEQYHVGARYNASPSQLLPVVTGEKPGELQFFSWGLLPHWAEGRGARSKPINARTETLTEKPTFRELLAQRRCLVPADGFYEWRKTATGKVPYRFLLHSGELFSFAGLWDVWADRETGEMVSSFAIITTEANELVRSTHSRMPVMLHPADEAAWLDVTTSDKMLRGLLQPYPAEEMKAYPVSSLVNTTANDSPTVLAPVPEQGSLF